MDNKDKQELVRKKFNMMKSLLRSKGWTDEQIMAKAIEKAGAQEFKEATKMDLPTSRYEELRRRYTEDYQIETVSELNALSQLIVLEVLQENYNKKVEKYIDKDIKVVAELTSEMRRNITTINDLKNQLGLKRTDGKAIIDNWGILKKKAHAWYLENKLDRTMRCPHCEKMFLMKYKVTDYESIAHPNYSGKTLCNKKLIELYKKKKLSKEDVGEILNCSPEYTEWLIKNYYK